MLTKQTQNINFSQGLNTKVDPKQIPIGQFLALNNSVFTTAGQLTKRNGFKALPSLPLPATTLTTFDGNLVAVGNALQAFLQGDSAWFDQGRIQPLELTTLPLVRSSASQLTVDTALDLSTNLIITGWSDSNSLSWYQIQDSITGQVAVGPVALPATSTRVRTFILGTYFIVTFTETVSASAHLRYIAIPIANPAAPLAVADIATTISAITAPYDGVVVDSNLYISWNGSDGGGALRTCFITAQLVQSAVTVVAGVTSTLISLTSDMTGNTPIIWVSLYSSTNVRALAYDPNLNPVLAITTISTQASVVNLSSAAQNAVLTVFYEVSDVYSGTSQRTDFVDKNTLTQAGVAGSPSVLLRGVGLGSKGFIIDSTIYVVVVYGTGSAQTGNTQAGLLQPTYLVSDVSSNIVGRFAYSNGGGYYPNYVLPSVSVPINEVVTVGYLYKDLIASVNPNNLTPPSTTSNIYSQTGINSITLDFTPKPFATSEIASNLHLGGGFLWMYDGIKPVEHGFNFFPEDVVVTTATGSGGLTAQQYYYQVVYEWTDAQGNIHRSAPSVPVGQLTTTSSSTNTIQVPTLRETYKTQVRITIFRWSTAQQNFFQITSISSPLLNDPTVDVVTFSDTFADSAILGNSLIYTTGSVIENICAPGTSITTLYKSRLFLVDSEDRNLLWFSKQVIEGTPVEMSDLLTLYVAPTIGAQGSTGKITALAAMDDKLIIFKQDAIYYVTGQGPDNTGASNDFSDPIFISSIVGCSNIQSLVLMQQGIMFQSDKGIWLLGRDLSVSYIGAPVESFNSQTVTSAAVIPETTQIRFTLNSKTILMYDYYYQQWGTFNTPQAVDSVLYEGLHTLLASPITVTPPGAPAYTVSAAPYQETLGEYLDGSTPVVMNFTTGWLNLAGLQGYQRAYYFYLLGTYISSHRLNIGLAYNYNPSITQTSQILPDNASPAWGGDSVWGAGAAWGGPSQLEQWRIFLQHQRCQSVQLTMEEVYDPTFSVAGAGLTVSGLAFVVGLKKGFRPMPASRSVG